MFAQLLNALTLKFDGDNGADAPSKAQVALVWGGVGFLVSRVL